MSVQLKLDQITCTYGSVEALSKASLEIKKGDFVGILGPNGSGKSTLLKALSRALKPTSGAVLIDGNDIWSLPIRQIAQEISVVPQETEIAFDFTVREVVMMGRSPHLKRFQIEGESDHEKVTRALEQTQLTNLADRPVTALSGGELQRTIIARALAQEPQILLLDEPTSHLDINYQIEILELVRKLNREQGITVVAVLHDLSLAAQFCDWLVLLKEARIFEFGTPTEVITTTKIREVYGTDVIVRRHPVTGRPYVISGSRPAVSHNGNGTRIHLICGGGSGAELMHRLVSEGYRISVGVLNVEDSDEETARLLSIPAVVEAPFSPVSPLSHKRNRQMALDADLVLVAETPFGYGNLLNLDAAESALEEGKPVIIIGSDFGSRDFVSGKAIEKLEKLITRGAYLVESIEEACRKAEEINAA